MKISKIDITPVSLPMRLFTDAYSGYDKGEFALVSIETDEGITGYGEAPCSVTVGFYGETLETVSLSLKKYLAPKLIGEDPLNITRLTSIMDIAQGNSFIAKTGMDLALYDLIGKALRVPCPRYLEESSGRKLQHVPKLGS